MSMAKRLKKKCVAFSFGVMEQFKPYGFERVHECRKSLEGRGVAVILFLCVLSNTSYYVDQVHIHRKHVIHLFELLVELDHRKSPDEFMSLLRKLAVFYCLNTIEHF